ncbi:MAG: hypothetical protein QXF61_04465, partial [Nitrososphaeria archaeon]
LFHKGKEPLTGYKIAKCVYGKEEFYSPVKVYQVLKELKSKNLIFEEEAIIKGKKAKIIKPNLLEFFKVLNERRMPKEYSLTNEEIETLANWFSGKDFNEVVNVEESVKKTVNVLDIVSVILKFDNNAELTEKISEKLKHLVVPPVIIVYLNLIS